MLTAARAQRCLKNAKEYLATDIDRSLENSTRLLDAGIENAEILHLACAALLKKGKYPQATRLLNKLLQYDAKRIDTYTYLVSCYAATANFTALAQLLARVQGIGAEGVDWTLLRVRIMNLLKMHAKAAALCAGLVEQQPENTEFHCMLGWHNQSLGDLAKAEKSYRAALAINPDTVRALYALSYLRQWNADHNNLVALQDFLQRDFGSASDLTFAHSALGKEYEDMGRYAEAFENFKKSADLTNKTTRYNAATDKRVLSSIRRWFESPEHVAGKEGYDDRRPLFIVGMPRTGSTLIDRILSSHSEVTSAGELMCFRMAVQELYGEDSRGDFFENFFEQPGLDIDFQAIGKRYIELAQPSAGNTRFFLDKMPMNYFFIGLIGYALPEARFIHSVRNPMDTCFSVYKQAFGKNFYQYSYDLENTAKHYLLYRDLMAFWHSLFPNRILDVEYENLVAQPAEEIRRMLDFCDLQWDENCLNFHSNKSAVDTASASQVRQPLYNTSVQKWRHYERELQPVKRIFLDAGIEL